MTKLKVPVSPEDHIQGPANSPLSLVEYGDFECPYCGQAYGIVKEAQDALGDDLRLIFRHFPLTQVHPHALGAAQAAEAAGRQGKFWQMHDLLFENQDALGVDDLRQHAERLGLDVDAFAQALGDARLSERIRRDFMGGVRSGVNGTPAFFINDIRHDGGWDAESLIESLRTARSRLHAAH